MTRLLGLGAIAALAAACSDTARLPTAPNSASNPPLATVAPPVPAVSGVVYESTAAGRRPLADVPLDISLEYQSWPAKVTTDADGRYTWSTNGSGLKVVGQKPGYSQPCRVALSATTVVQDVYLVADETLETSGVPASMPIVEPVLRGRVFERTPSGEKGISGASVILDFTGGWGWAPSATTVTDSAGRYVLCNVQDVGFGFYALVSKPGYKGEFVSVDVTPSATFDIELHR